MPVPEKGRKPLTEIQAFDLHVEHRAVGRADFDQKVRLSVISTIKGMLAYTSSELTNYHSFWNNRSKRRRISTRDTVKRVKLRKWYGQTHT